MRSPQTNSTEALNQSMWCALHNQKTSMVELDLLQSSNPSPTVLSSLSCPILPSQPFPPSRAPLEQSAQQHFPQGSVHHQNQTGTPEVSEQDPTLLRGIVFPSTYHRLEIYPIEC